MTAPEIQRGKERQPENVEELEKTVTVDTLHNDEALKVLANYAGDEEWTPEEERKLVRKIDRRLLSILCLTYGLQYYDKAMLSQAVRRTFQLMTGLTQFPGRRFLDCAKTSISMWVLDTPCQHRSFTLDSSLALILLSF